MILALLIEWNSRLYECTVSHPSRLPVRHNDAGVWIHQQQLRRMVHVPRCLEQPRPVIHSRGEWQLAFECESVASAVKCCGTYLPAYESGS